MTPTEILKHEHKVIELVLQGAEKESGKIKETGNVDYGIIEKFIDFTRNFTDGCHHAKEEHHLFPKMGEKGFSKDAGPIAIMLMEHVAGRSFISQIEESLKLVKNGDATAKDRLAESLYEYINLLRNHIYKEENILFNMADQAFSIDEQNLLAAAFEKVEEEEIGTGVHEKYHKLAHEIAGM